jgi:homoserine O-acetyltransferase
MDALMPLASLPSQISGRNRVWRRIAIDAIRLDPQWQRRRLQRAAAGLRTRRADAVPDGQQSRAASAADAGSRAERFGLRRAVADSLRGADANDVLYQLEASHDYDPAPGWRKSARRCSRSTSPTI